MNIEISEDQASILRGILHEQEYSLNKYCTSLKQREHGNLAREVDTLLDSIGDILNQIGRDPEWEHQTYVNDNMVDAEMSLKKVRDLMLAIGD